MIQLLNGMRVVELASYIMGPIAGRVLGEWGAEVIKVEPAIKQTFNPMDGDGDLIRAAGLARSVVNGDPCIWEFINGNKKSVCINTRTPEGRKAMIDLCLSADVVISHLRQKDAKKLGVDYDSLSAQKPDIIVASTSGYGITGPDAERGGFDAVAFAARSGMINGLIDCTTPHIIKGRIIKVKNETREEIYSPSGLHLGAEIKEVISNKMVFNVLTPTGFKALT